MFARLLWGIFRSSSGRLIVALLALTSGAAVLAALLTMQADVQGKLSSEFRTLGPNLIIQPPQALQTAREINSAATTTLLDASVIRAATAAGIPGMSLAPYLYVVAQANGRPVVVAGTWASAARSLSPSWKLVQGRWMDSSQDDSECMMGRDAAHALGLASGDQIHLQTSHASLQLTIAGILEAGADEDNQVIISLGLAQRMAGTPGKISLIAANVPGTTAQIEQARRRLDVAVPTAEVRPLRQITEAQGDMASRLRVLVASMVILILLLTLLCVLATMAALAVERRRDVGLMRALGGSISRVVSLFLAEAALLGALSGLGGYLIGIVLARWVGGRVFQSLVSPQWKVLPLTVAVMVAVALAGALPLRMLGKVPPGAILRGEA